MLGLAAYHVQRYDEVNFHRIDTAIDIENDGFRELNIEWRQMVEFMLLRFYEQLGIATSGVWREV